MLLVVEEVLPNLIAAALTSVVVDYYRTEAGLHHSRSDYYSLPEVSSLVESMKTFAGLEKGQVQKVAHSSLGYLSG